VSLVALGEIVDIKGGGTPDKSVACYWNGDVPWASVKDFKTTTLDRTSDYITQAGVDNSATNIIPAGTIVVPTRMAVGKAAIAGIDLAINQDLKALFPKKTIDTRYLLHALLASSDHLERHATGATVKGITLNVLKELKIPLPSLPEQRRIAAILDQADALRRLRRQSLSRLSDLKSAIFNHVFNGRNDSEVIPLSEVVAPGTIITYGIVQAGEEFDGGIPYIRTGDIKGGLILCDNLRHTDPAIAAKFERSRVRAGEIVMSIRATVGTTALVPEMLDGANLTQGTARIAPGPRTHRTFLLEYLRSAPVQQWIQQQVKGATFREITLSRLRDLPVQVPPIDVQERFAQSIQELENQEKILNTHLDGTESFFASLQHRAFRGEL
jgi:type I restriction enzyme, S subunit